VYDVHDWAEVHRLHYVQGLGKAAIAAKLGMSRTTVHRLLGLREPPRYARRPAGWLPLMPDTLAKLEEGAIVCDVGCGRGRALSKLAAAFPRSRFVGYDLYEPAIRAARARMQDAGVADRVRLEVRDAVQGLGERFDVVTTFDVLHDSADPRAIVSAIRSALAPDGRYICLEINCADRPEENVGPLGTVLYGLSLAYCLPVSLAEGGAGLGTLGLPESKLTELTTITGFSKVRRLPIDDPFNSVYELTP
jgi:2-polyprenyl-3-methyl-5-hydroxy-6-metoxy-1,4-benzoquinol methylase